MCVYLIFLRHVGKNGLDVGKIRVLVVIMDVDVGIIDVHVGKIFFSYSYACKQNTLRVKQLLLHRYASFVANKKTRRVFLLTERSLDKTSKEKGVQRLPFPIKPIITKISVLINLL